MKLKDIFKDKSTKIFRVIQDDVDNELNIEIEPTTLEVIPDENGYFIVSALEVKANKVTKCFMDMHTPERLSEMVLKKGLLGTIKITEFYEHEGVVIPGVASDCFGIYELYYSKENPEIGIEVLRNGLPKASNKNIIAEDLGYILRDENRIDEAIEAFNISEKRGVTTPYTYLELSHLFGKLQDSKRKEYYYTKFIENGGKIIN